MAWARGPCPPGSPPRHALARSRWPRTSSTWSRSCCSWCGSNRAAAAPAGPADLAFSRRTDSTHPGAAPCGTRTRTPRRMTTTHRRTAALAAAPLLLACLLGRGPRERAGGPYPRRLPARRSLPLVEREPARAPHVGVASVARRRAVLVPHPGAGPVGRARRSDHVGLLRAPPDGAGATAGLPDRAVRRRRRSASCGGPAGTPPVPRHRTARALRHGTSNTLRGSIA